MGMEGVDVSELTPEWARRGGWSREAQDYIDKKAAQAATANSAAAEIAAGGKTASQSTPHDWRGMLREGPKDAGRAVGKPGVGGAALGAGTAIASAYDSFSRPTDDYLRRFGMDQNNFGGVGGVGARALGVAGDFGAALLDTPVDTVNLAARLLGGKGDFRLPGGSFTEKLQERDKPPGGAPQKTGAPIVGSIPPTPQPDAAREAARFAEQARQSFLPLRDQGPAGAAPAPGGITVTRGANGTLEFSGTNVRGAPSYIGEGAELMAGRSGGGVSAQNLQAAQALSDRDQLAARASALRSMGDPGPQYRPPTPRHSGNDWQARNDLRNLEVSASSFTASPEKKAAYAQALGLDQMLRAGADPGTIARIQAETQKHGHDQSLRGQMYAADQGLRGHALTAQNQYRVGQLEFIQKQQDRALMQTLMQMTDDNPRKAADLATKSGRPDLGNLLLDNYEKGIKASSSVSSGNDTAFKNVLDTVLKTVPDRDANKDARYARSLQAHMGNEIARLEEYVAKHPGDKDSADQLTRLRRRDISVMEGNSEAMLRFSLGMRLKEMAEKNHGIMPWAGTTVMQDEPVRYISKEVIPASVAGVNLPGHRGFYRTDRGDLIPVADVENDPLFSISPPHSNTFATMKR